MRSSKLDTQVYDVFPYDFIGGPEGLKSHLSRLQKDASENGDINFVFADGEQHRTYSPLFYVAAGNVHHNVFGTGTADGGKGNLYVPEGKDLECIIEAILEKCYTKETLAGLWKTMNEVPPRAEGPRAVFKEPVLKAGLSGVLAPDFTIHIKELGNPEPVYSARVHRFLLPIRIAYFRAQFSSAFRDAHATEATFYTEEFTNCGLWAVVAFVYDTELWTMFDGYNLDKHMNGSPVAPGGGPDCSLYSAPGGVNGGNSKIPPVEIIDRLFEIVRAADFLQISDLKHWAHYSIVRMAHEFTCLGASCAHIVPYVLEQVHNCEVSDTWIYTKALNHLSTRGIGHLWKRPLLKCSEEITSAVVQKVHEEMRTSEQRMVEIYLRIHQHASLVATSNLKEDWHRRIIDPLLDAGALMAAEKLDNSKIVTPLSIVLKTTTFAKPAIHDLILRATSHKIINQSNCPRVFRGIRQLEKAIAPLKSDALCEARESVVLWLRKNWLSLSLLPAPGPTFAPIGGRGGNYFSLWSEKDKHILAAELKISLIDLLAIDPTTSSSSTASGGGARRGRSFAYDPAFGRVRTPASASSSKSRVRFWEKGGGSGSAGGSGRGGTAEAQVAAMDEWGNEGLSETGAEKGSLSGEGGAGAGSSVGGGVAL
ncbi:hypothetical protein L873DRAFT_1790446 [Choiromyces venosus 120613-1]|uniref:BTB domain-containing protein n=1 Tax=Choiromyces venosus 120613-1 TaxID=1336337 RepID=A0A3N4JIK8_9PEZI|nr:hypothetical protein L873DRAFT_1790446 [Choiromyces venosus 120613-1]